MCPLLTCQRVVSSPGVRAVGITAGQDVTPQLLGDGARRPVVAGVSVGRALAGVAQEKQPALLLADVLIALPHVLRVRTRVRSGRRMGALTVVSCLCI